MVTNTQTHKSHTVFKCINSDILYDEQFSNICRGDPKFYQVCGIIPKITYDSRFGDFVLCGDFICNMDNLYIMPSFLLSSHTICNGFVDCINTNIDEVGCAAGSQEYVTMRTGRQMKEHLICNDVCDDLDFYCEDEADCNNFSYGIYCVMNRPLPTLWYLQPEHICDVDGFRNCVDGEDEEHCTITNATEHTCTRSQQPVTNYSTKVPLFNNTRCSIFVYDSTKIATNICSDYMDQTNCSDVSKVGVTCNINNFTSTVSKLMVCQGFTQICDDNMENLCYSISHDCFIHKHRICDGAKDCSDGSDEKSILCLSLTQEKCSRKGRTGFHSIPLAWLADNVADCLDGIDEVGTWPTCGKGITKRFVINNQICKDVFLCQEGNLGFVQFQKLCDGVESCGSENNVCEISRGFPEIFTSVSNVGPRHETKNLLYCLRGMRALNRMQGDFCFTTFFRYPMHKVLGISKGPVINLPLSKKNCDHMFGETYLYMSCTSSCIKSKCPLTSYPKIDSCPDQFPQQFVGSYASDMNGDAYLTFLKKSRNLYRNDYFVCETSKKCLPYAKVCDLVDDCGDFKDEAHCTNHFKCANQMHLIPKDQKCDGSFDCLDFSDECNDQCSEQILDGYILKCMSGLFGGLAVLFNGVNIGISITNIRKCKKFRPLSNKSLVLLISFGDFLVGLYLSIVFAFDIYYWDKFCILQAKWRTGVQCSFLGVISTAGSFISIFSMACLSLIRLSGIQKSLIASPPINKRKIIELSIVCFLIVVSSILLSILPIIRYYEDFFVNGLSYAPELKLFIGFPNKIKHFDIIQAYYGRMKISPMSWKLIKNMVRDMFSQDYGGLTNQIKTVDFFGNDVCFFKYFVTSKDPQRYFVWSVLGVHFFCLLYIAFCYISIAAISKNIGSNVGKGFKGRNQRTQRKIKLLIATDFICWFLFIIICVLHSFEVVDATKWYSILTILVLPINSVLNPVLYETFHLKVARKFINAVIHAIRVFSNDITSRSVANPDIPVQCECPEKETNKEETASIIQISTFLKHPPESEDQQRSISVSTHYQNLCYNFSVHT